MGLGWLGRSLRQRIRWSIFQIRELLGLREGGTGHGVFATTWMSQSFVETYYHGAAHVTRADTRINVVQIIKLGLVLLKLDLQVMP